MSLIDDLKEARGHVEAGWIKHRIKDSDGNVCIMGAVERVTESDWRDSYCHVSAEPDFTRYQAMRQALIDHLPGEFSTIPKFNDDGRTTKQDALHLFDKTLADLGGLA